MADEWQPANDVERALLDAMQRGEQDHYFEVLGATDLILPFAADATGAAQPGTWATWGYEGRTYILAFTSQQALASIMGGPTDQFRSGRLAEICAWWPDESWWLAVDFGLPIAGYLPGTFVSQLTGVQLGAQLAVGAGAPTDPTVAYRPAQQSDAAQQNGATSQQPDPLQTQQTSGTPPVDPAAPAAAAQPADPGQTVPAVPTTDRAGAAPSDAPHQPTSAQPYQQPTSAQPYQQGGAPPYEPVAAAGQEPAYPPGDAAAQYEQQAGAAQHAEPAAPSGPPEQRARPDAQPAAGAQPGTMPVLSNDAAGVAGFQPASPLEQTLLDASRTGDRKTFMDALLGAYLLVPVPEGAAPGPTAVTAPDFPWPSIERNGTPQVPVFTSQERMRERVGAAPYAVVPFVLVVEHWPHREWYLALNPDTPVSATVDGDQIAELAEWARRTHLAERLGVLPPQQPEQPPLVPAQPVPVSSQPASADHPVADASPWSASTDRAAEPGEPVNRPDGPADQPDGAAYQPDGAVVQPDGAAEAIAPGAAEPDAAERPAAEPEAVEPETAEPGAVEPETAGRPTAEREAAEPDTGERPSTDPGEAGAGAEERGAADQQVVEQPPEEGGAGDVPAARMAGDDADAATGEPAADEGAANNDDTAADDDAAAASARDGDAPGGDAPGGDAPDGDAPGGNAGAAADGALAEGVGDTVGGSSSGTAHAAVTGPDPAAEPSIAAEVDLPDADDAGPASDESARGAAEGDPAQSATGPAGAAQVHDDGEPAPEWPPVPPAVEDESTPVAEPVPPLSFPALLQKVLPDAQVPFYLERHFDRVGGWIHLASDAPVRAGDLRVATGLSSEVAAEPAHAIRWHVETEQLLPVLAAVRSSTDPELAEYRVPTARLPHGAELYRIDPDGATTVLAVFNADHHRWHPLI